MLFHKYVSRFHFIPRSVRHFYRIRRNVRDDKWLERENTDEKKRVEAVEVRTRAVSEASRQLSRGEIGENDSRSPRLTTVDRVDDSR